MKKIYFVLGLILLITGCSIEENIKSEQNVKQQSNQRFYGIKTPEQTRGVAQIKKLWYPGTTIDIKFLNGSQEFKQKVLTYAAEWEQYANITFNFIEQGDTDVRITFDSNNSRYVTWSTIGTDCKMITNQSEPTMNFVDWDYLYEEEIKGDVLRAFGQVLGLELEHRHIDFDAGWRDNISLYWQGSIEDIPWDELKKYVFDPLESSKVLQTDEYDEESIMIWPFPRQFALNTARDYNFELSGKDIEFIKEVYPKKDNGEEPIAEMEVGFFTRLIIKSTSDFYIDFGDGNKEMFIGAKHTITRTLPENTIVKIYGNGEDLKELYVDKGTEFLGNINISKCTGLENFYIYANPISELDVSKNIKLQSIELITNNLQSIDLTNNGLLNSIYLFSDKIELIDTSQNPELRSFSCGGKLISSLDFTNNPQLDYLYINSTSIVSLDLSQNLVLKSLSCRYNNLTSLDISNNIYLESLECIGNLITSLDISNNIHLERVECIEDQITSLDISNNVNLIKLTCEPNIMSLDATNNLILQDVIWYSNEIKQAEDVISFVQSLPDRSSTYSGRYSDNRYNVEHILDIIIPILESKNWELGQIE